MKPESLKFMLNCYLKEKINTYPFDDIDGIELPRAHCGAEPCGLRDDRLSEFTFLHPQQAVAVVPQLLDDYLSPEGQEIARSVARQLSELSDDFELNRSRSTSFSSQGDSSGNNFVQFKNRCIFASPTEDKVQITVLRVGNAEEVAKVRWETIDKTAKSGVHYHESGGEISFGEGETEKTIEVDLVRNQGVRNISFLVNLLYPEEIMIGSDNPLTVYIADHSNLFPVERQVVDNIINSPPNASASEIAICLHDDLTVNTFRTAIQYKCSYFDSVPQGLAFAFELVKLSVGKAPLETLGKVVCEFFSHLPELEHFAEAFN